MIVGEDVFFLKRCIQRARVWQKASLSFVFENIPVVASTGTDPEGVSEESALS